MEKNQAPDSFDKVDSLSQEFVQLDSLDFDASNDDLLNTQFMPTNGRVNGRNIFSDWD